MVNEFRVKNFDPEGYTLYSYAAVQLFKQAAEKAKSLETKKIAEVLHSGMNFKTVIGDVSFDANGRTTDPEFVMYRWQTRADGRTGFFE